MVRLQIVRLQIEIDSARDVTLDARRAEQRSQALQDAPATSARLRAPTAALVGVDEQHAAFETGRWSRARAPDRPPPARRSRPCPPTAARRAAARRAAPGIAVAESDSHRDSILSLRLHAPDSRVRVAAPRRAAARGRLRVRRRPSPTSTSGRAPGEAPATYVRRLAAEKSARGDARRQAGRRGESGGRADVVILGADTAVVVDGEILGKPRDDADAERMLRRLSGRAHEVMTGVSLRRGADELGRVETTRVAVRGRSATTTSPGTSRAERGATRPARTRFRAWRRGSSRDRRLVFATWSACRSPAVHAAARRDCIRRGSRAILTSSSFPGSPYDTSIYQDRRDRRSSSCSPSPACCGRTLRDGTEYFKHVDEVMSESAGSGKASTLQLHGFVVPGSILRKPDTLEYKFKVQNNP